MGYTKPIETKNAEYVVSLETHTFPDYSAFASRKFDLAVIESGMERDKYDTEKIKKFQKIAKCDVILLDPPLTKAKLGLYGVRWAAGSLILLFSPLFLITPRSLMSRRSALKLFAASLAAGNLLEPRIPSAIAEPITFGGEIRARKPLMEIDKYIGKLYFPLLVDARNAIIAEKLEGTIAPSLKKELGRAPRIAIQIGAGHAGIVDYLQDAGARRAAIFRLRDKISRGLVREHLDKAYRVRWDEKAKDLRFEEMKAPIMPLLERTKPMKFSRRQFFRKFRRKA